MIAEAKQISPWREWTLALLGWARVVWWVIRGGLRD